MRFGKIRAKRGNICERVPLTTVVEEPSQQWQQSDVSQVADADAMLEEMIARSNALSKLDQEAAELRELMAMLVQHVQLDSHRLDSIEDWIAESEGTCETAGAVLQGAAKKKTVSRLAKIKGWFSVLATSSALGCAAAGPVGALVGLKAALVVLTVGGAGASVGIAGRLATSKFRNQECTAEDTTSPCTRRIGWLPRAKLKCIPRLALPSASVVGEAPGSSSSD